MSIKLAVYNCNSRICAPGSADSGAAESNTCVCGELTAVKDRAVYDSVAGALVGALECCDVACSTLIVLSGIDNVDSTVLEEGGVVSTEDEIGVTGNVYVLEILTSGEELKSILDTKKLRILHYESVSLNKECKSSLDVDFPVCQDRGTGQRLS